jgi:hypothetical protein
MIATPEVGNFHDNEAVYARAIYAIAHGYKEFALKALIDLRNILVIGEVKSIVHLLPDIEEVLRCATSSRCHPQ